MAYRSEILIGEKFDELVANINTARKIYDTYNDYTTAEAVIVAGLELMKFCRDIPQNFIDTLTKELS